MDKTTDRAEIANSTSVVITSVQGNRNSIGYISLGSLSRHRVGVGTRVTVKLPLDTED